MPKAIKAEKDYVPVAVLLISPDSKEANMRLHTNGVRTIDMINCLNAMQKQLAQILVEEGIKIVGNDSKKLEKWLDDQYNEPSNDN